MAEEMLDLINADMLGSLIPGLSEKAGEMLLNQVGAFVIGNERFVPKSLLIKQLQTTWKNPSDTKPKTIPVERKTVIVQKNPENRLPEETKQLISDLKHKLELKEEECEKLRVDNKNYENAFASMKEAAKDNGYKKLQDENDMLVKKLREYEKQDNARDKLKKKVDSLEHDLKIIRDVCAQKDEEIKRLENKCRSNFQIERKADDENRKLLSELETYKELIEEAQKTIDEGVTREENLKSLLKKAEDDRDIAERKYSELAVKAEKAQASGAFGGIPLRMQDEFYENELSFYINMLAGERLRMLQQVKEERKRDYDLALFLYEYTKSSSTAKDRFRKQISDAIEKAMNEGKTGDLSKLGFEQISTSRGNFKMVFRGNGRYTIIFSKHQDPNPRTVKNASTTILGILTF